MIDTHFYHPMDFCLKLYKLDAVMDDDCFDTEHEFVLGENEMDSLSRP